MKINIKLINPNTFINIFMCIILLVLITLSIIDVIKLNNYKSTCENLCAQHKGTYSSIVHRSNYCGCMVEKELQVFNIKKENKNKNEKIIW